MESLKLAILIVSSQIFYFSGHAGKKQVVNRACCAAKFAFCCTVRIALQNSQRALICHRVPAQPGGGPGGGIAKKNLSKFPEVDIPQSRNSLKPKFPKVKSPPQKKMKRFKERFKMWCWFLLLLLLLCLRVCVRLCLSVFACLLVVCRVFVFVVVVAHY